MQVLRHDIGEKKAVGTISEAYPRIILDNFTSALGQRVSNILKFLFPSPKACSHICAQYLTHGAALQTSLFDKTGAACQSGH